jgi:hypothetical protein
MEIFLPKGIAGIDIYIYDEQYAVWLLYACKKAATIRNWADDMKVTLEREIK